MRRSKSLVGAHRTIDYWGWNLMRAIWRARDQFHTAQENEAFEEIRTILDEAKHKIDALFAPAVGAAVLKEKVKL